MSKKIFFVGLGVGLALGAVVSSGALKAQEQSDKDANYTAFVKYIRAFAFDKDASVFRAYQYFPSSHSPLASDQQATEATRDLEGVQVVQNQRIIELLEQINKKGGLGTKPK